MTAIRCEDIENFKKLGKALKISNGKFDVIVTLDVGPRVMHLSLAGRENMFEDEVDLCEKLPDGTEWRLYGGHRVWHSPEAFPRSYISDGQPLDRYEIFEDGIMMYQKEEEWTKIVKAIEVRFLEGSIQVTNHLTNNGAWPLEVAVWSLTHGARDGREVCPVVQRNTGLLPNAAYVNWPYSRMNDPRVYWGQKYIVVDNDRENKSAFKFGYANELGWAAYFNKGQCFIKKYSHDRNGKYPDMGCSWETYTGYTGIELETLSPLQILGSMKSLAHSEEWYVFDCPDRPSIDEEEIDRFIQPMSQSAGFEMPVLNSEGWDPTFEEKE